MSANAYRYRLTFQFSKKGVINLRVDEDHNAHKVTMPGPEGAQPISLASFGSPIKQADMFQLSQGGFHTAEAAWKEAQENAVALTFVAAELDVGVDFGKVDIGEYNNEKAEPSHFSFSDGLFGDLNARRIQMVGQKLGITVVEQPEVDYDFVSVRMHADLHDKSLTPDGFLQAWSKAGEQGKTSLSAKESLALELYNNSFFEKSSRTQLLTLMQLIESLAPRIERPKKVRSTLESLIHEVRAEKLRLKADEALELSYAGIASTLVNLKYESISTSISSFAEDLCGGGRFGGLTPSEFVKKCYSLRSSLTHSGTANISEQEFINVIRALRQLCLMALRRQIGFSPIKIQKDWVAPANLVGGIQFEGESFVDINDLASASEINQGVSQE